MTCYYYARYFLSCGHMADIPATLQEVRNPVVCQECSHSTELCPEVLDLLTSGSVRPGTTGPAHVH